MPKQTPQQIHKQYDVLGDDVQVSINHQYMKMLQSWKFSGYKCGACNKGFKFVSSLLKHKNTCKVLNNLKGKRNANTNDNS